MNNNNLINTLEEALATIPVFDVHTHLDANHLSARGLHDVLLYHMVISDLVSAGCPSRARLSEDPDNNEVELRLTEALPYLPYIQNTSGYWGVRIILHDLYDWTEPLTMHNWKRLHEIIKERSKDKSWAYQIFTKSNICRASTELWRRHDGSRDDVLQFSLEWALFARAQWDFYDSPLYELEQTWSESAPGIPLPVRVGSHRKLASRPILTVANVQEAINNYVAKIPFDQVISTAQQISTDIHYGRVSDDDMLNALQHRNQASPADRDIYASYILEAFLNELESKAEKIVVQFSLGAEPLPFETGSKLRQETIFELASLIARHSNLRFQVLLSCEHLNQSLCTLARELPNLSLAGYWWHNLFPSIIRKVISDRLDMLAVNKQVGFFSDAYCVDWTYAKWKIVCKQLAEVLAKKINQGQYTLDESLGIAHQILFTSAQSLNGMVKQ